MHNAELHWHKSSYSSSGDGDCVEVATDVGAAASVHVRDSKDRDGGQLALPAAAWTDFLTYAVGD